MHLSGNNKTCKQGEILLILVGDEIRGINLQTNYYVVPAITYPTNVTDLNTVDFLFADNRLYWTDKSGGEIWSSGLASGKSIVVSDLTNIDGFAVDYLARHMYISTVGRIRVCTLNGEYTSEIIGDLYGVNSLALDPSK